MAYNPTNPELLAKLGPEYTAKQPIGMFFDKAVPDGEHPSGRPRFKNVTYLRKIMPGKKESVFERKAVDGDQDDFPQAWEHYLGQKAKVAQMQPPVEGIPGIGIADIAELHAIEIRDMQQLVEYYGDLDGLEKFRRLARKILSLTDDPEPPAQVVPIKRDEPTDGETFTYEIAL